MIRLCTETRNSRITAEQTSQVINTEQLHTYGEQTNDRTGTETGLKNQNIVLVRRGNR